MQVRRVFGVDLAGSTGDAIGDSSAPRDPRNPIDWPGITNSTTTRMEECEDEEVIVSVVKAHVTKKKDIDLIVGAVSPRGQ